MLNIGSRARVKLTWWNADKGYGKAVAEDETELFVHVRGYRVPTPFEGKVCFPREARGAADRPAEPPIMQEGMILVGDVAPAQRGGNNDQLTPWCLAEEYERAEVRANSSELYYRCLCRASINPLRDGDENHEWPFAEQILLNNERIPDVRRMRAGGSDPTSFKSQDPGFKLTFLWFSRKAGSSQWTPCDDPLLPKVKRSAPAKAEASATPAQAPVQTAAPVAASAS